MVESKRPVDVFVDVLIHVVIVIACFLCLIPLLNTLALSFSSSVMASSGTVSFWPKQFTLAAYEAIVGEKQFFGAFWISIKRVVLGGAINFLMMVLCAFPLAHSEKAFRGRNVYMYFLIFTMLFSGGLVPTYIVSKQLLGLSENYAALIVPLLVSPFNIIVMRSFFKSSVPLELIEAATIDGSGEYSTLFRVVVPIAKPGIATIALLNALAYWNDWFNSLLYIQQKKVLQPLQALLMELQNNTEYLNRMAGMLGPDAIAEAAKMPSQALRMVLVVFIVVPIACAYPFFQRYIVSGLTVGSVKG